VATRRERVVLELEDNFTSGMARAAASAALLNKELDSLSRDSVKTQRSFSDIDKSSTKFGNSAERSGKQIDKLSGRLRILTDAATLIGPAFIPVAGLAVPAVAGLASQLGFATIAAGTTLLAFQGVGDALTKVNKAAIDPTTTNLKNAQLALEKLSPAAQKFVAELRTMIPAAKELQGVAADGLFPGVTEGLVALEDALPRVEAIVSAVSHELGAIAADTGKSLASDRWAPFLEFLATEAPAALRDMSDAAGNVVHAMAELWMAFEPLNNDFSNWLVDATADLDRWASGLSKTEGFHEFVAFIEEHGPQVADTFAAIGDAVIQVVDAAAPLSGPVLQGIEGLAKALAAIADSDIGTPLFTAAAALALFNRTMAIASAGRNGLAGFEARLGTAGVKARGFGANIQATRADLVLLSSTALTAGARTERELLRMNAASARLRTNFAPIGKGAAVMGGLAIASTGAADGLGLTNTASLALLGSIGGAPGAVAGGLVGALLDAKDASDGFASSLKGVDDVIASGNLDQMLAKLAQLKKARDDASNVTGVGDFFGDLFTQVRSNPLPTPELFGGGGKDPISKLEDNIKRVQDATKGAASTAATSVVATDAYGNAIGKVGDTSQDTATKIAGLVDAMKSQRQEALSAFDAETRYRQALKDAQAQAAKSDAGIRGSTDEALKNRAVIDELAGAWNNQSDAVKNNEAKFKAAKQAFIDTAVGMGVPIEQAKRLAKRLLEIPEEKVIGVKFDSINALNAINRIKRELAEIPKRLRTDYFVVQTNSYNKKQAGGRDGDPTTPFATGGWTGPGAKYQPAGVVHADEYVFSKEATHGNVAYLNDLHRQLRGYADGGLVRRGSMSPVSVSVSAGAGPQIDYDQLALAMAAVRPLYGDVHISGDPTTFRRQMQQDRRASASDGIRR
jgi:hypothetical protein